MEFYEPHSISIISLACILIWFPLLQVGPGIIGAGAAVALAARLTGEHKKEDKSVWVS